MSRPGCFSRFFNRLLVYYAEIVKTKTIINKNGKIVTQKWHWKRFYNSNGSYKKDNPLLFNVSIRSQLAVPRFLLSDWYSIADHVFHSRRTKEWYTFTQRPLWFCFQPFVPHQRFCYNWIRGSPFTCLCYLISHLNLQTNNNCNGVPFNSTKNVHFKKLLLSKVCNLIH